MTNKKYKYGFLISYFVAEPGGKAWTFGNFYHCTDDEYLDVKKVRPGGEIHKIILSHDPSFSDVTVISISKVQPNSL